MNASKRRQLFARLAAANPAPRTELEYASSYQFLVAVILSAQATDKSVNQACKALFARHPDACAMLALGEEGLIEHIKRIGLYRNKAKNILAMTRQLIERHQGVVPHDRTALEALPGVGRKTAGVVLNVIFGEPTIAVDTHVFRVANRTGLATAPDVRSVEEKLLKSVPPEYLHHAHHWLILHGRYVCKARQPECHRCPIRDLCEYSAKTP